MSRIFEIVQAMSGQGNCITIPAPYLDFVFGDPQAHLLGAILNQRLTQQSATLHIAALPPVSVQRKSRAIWKRLSVPRPAKQVFAIWDQRIHSRAGTRFGKSVPSASRE